MELLDTIVAGNEFNGDSMSREQVNLPALSDSNMRRIHWGLESHLTENAATEKAEERSRFFSFLCGQDYMASFVTYLLENV